MRHIIKLTLILLSFTFGYADGQGKPEDIWQLITDYRTGQYCYISEKGDTMIPPGRYKICFSEIFDKYAIVLHPDKGIVAIDKKGKILYNVFVFDNGPDPVSEGMFRIVNNNRIGYADAATGKVVIRPAFTCAYPFAGGTAKVSNSCTTKKDGEYSIWESDNWSFINRSGKKIVPAKKPK